MKLLNVWQCWNVFRVMLLLFLHVMTGKPMPTVHHLGATQHTQTHTIHPSIHLLLCTEDISSGAGCLIQLLSSPPALLCRTACGRADLDVLSLGHSMGIGEQWGAVGLPLVVDKTRLVYSCEGTSWPITCECSFKLHLSLYVPSVLIFLCCSSSLLSSAVFTAVFCLHESHSRAFSHQHWFNPHHVKSLVITLLHLGITLYHFSW